MIEDDWPPVGYEEDMRPSDPPYGLSDVPGYSRALHPDSELPRKLTRAEVGRFNSDLADYRAMQRADAQAEGRLEVKDIVALKRAGIIDHDEARRMLNLPPTPKEAQRMVAAEQQRRHQHPMQRRDPNRYRAPHRGLFIRFLEATT